MKETKLKDIPSGQLTIKDVNAATQGQPSIESIKNNPLLDDKTTPVLIGDTLTVGTITAKVTKLEYIGMAYGIQVHTDNGQKINATTLIKLIKENKITVS